jgi:hypothetical protein
MLNDAELQYYYLGFYRALKRYRTTSLLGWSIVFLGCLSIPFGWNLGRSTGFIEVVLTALTVIAGLTVVWQNISALDEYIRTPFPSLVNGEASVRAEIISEIKGLMHEIDKGGWQDAYAAIAKLIELGAKHDLPKLEP